MKALLIHCPDRCVAEEAAAVVEAAGYEVEGTLPQRYLERAKYGVGEGKAEEAATLVLLTVDASQPTSGLRSATRAARASSRSSTFESRILVVMNKAALVSGEEMGEKMWAVGIRDAVSVSAKTGEGVRELLREISSRLAGHPGVKVEA